MTVASPARSPFASFKAAESLDRADVRVVIADDHRLLRQSLASLLDQQPGIGVVAQAGTGFQALQALARCRPDVLVLDVSMSEMRGLEIVHEAKRRWPTVGILVLTAAAEDRLALRCLRSGADGYLTHDHSDLELREAVYKVADGGKYVTEELADQLASSLQNGDDRPPHDSLSDREFQVMCLIAEGIPPTKIASQLGLSVKTVSTYRSRLLKKLDLGNSAEIMRYAMTNRLVQ